MKILSILRSGVVPAVFALWLGPALAQETPRQIQDLIANGQDSAALSALNNVLQAHPDSGIAWYLTAEAQDNAGNLAAARTALAKAEQYAPGLPFAKPDDVAALQAHLAGGGAMLGHAGGHVALIIGGFVVLFFLLRMFGRSRRRMAVNPPGFGYGERAGRPFPYGPGGGAAYGPGGGAAYGPGGGMGSSLLSGLAAGAGFAAGERIIDDVMGNRGIDQGFGNTPMPSPDRDDGLLGSPGWDSGNSDNAGNDDNQDNGGGFDPGNSW